MASFVPHYKYDIFISYAHADNSALSGNKKGWVTTLLKSLERRLTERIGRRELWEWFYDKKDLNPHKPFSSQIMKNLNDSAVILIIFSPGYVASPWCLLEKNTFLSLIEERNRLQGSRVILVERDMVEKSDRPKEFIEILGRKFWQSGNGRPQILESTEKNYRELVNDLTYDIIDELKRIKNLKDDTREPVSRQTPTVFLAEVTDDLEPQRDDVKRYLNQHQLSILPENLYSRETPKFRKAINNDLKNSVLFVQLISHIPGKSLPDQSMTYAQLQYECAVQAKIPILQWRSRDLDLSKASQNQQAFLKNETVMAVGIDEFKATVVSRTKPPALKKKPANAFVFVNMDTNDKELAEKVRKYLNEYGVETALPIRKGNYTEVREDFEGNLLDCDGIVIIYGKSTRTWVRRHLRQCRKILAMRDSPLKALAIYEGPPEPKEKLEMELLPMSFINCRKNFSGDKLNSFIESLKEE